MNKKKRILIKFAVLFLILIFSIGAIFFSLFYNHILMYKFNLCLASKNSILIESCFDKDAEIMVNNQRYKFKDLKANINKFFKDNSVYLSNRYADSMRLSKYYINDENQIVLEITFFGEINDLAFDDGFTLVLNNTFGHKIVLLEYYSKNTDNSFWNNFFGINQQY